MLIAGDQVPVIELFEVVGNAANVAPEFGVAETRALITILDGNGLYNLSERFLKLAYDSKKWDKWMRPNTSATDRDRAIIAGHYVFSKAECIELKAEAAKELFLKGIDLEQYLKAQVKESILRYLRNFRLVRAV